MEIESMTLNEFLEEYSKHPMILRLDGVDGKDWHADILLTRQGMSVGGCGFSHRYGEAIQVQNLNINPDGKMRFDVRREYIPTIPPDNIGDGFLYCNSGSFHVEQIEKTKPAMATLPAEYLVDGATLPVSYEAFAQMYAAFNEFPLILIQTEMDGKMITTTSLFTSVDMETYATTVKCISPTNGELITLTFVLDM
jgi:hypothetical protein